MSITKPTKPTISLKVTDNGRYVAEYKRTVATAKTPQQLGALLRRETKEHVQELRTTSPVSTGLLKRSWLYYTEAVAIRDTPVKRTQLALGLAGGLAGRRVGSIAPDVITSLRSDPRVTPVQVNELARTLLGTLLKGIANTPEGRRILIGRVLRLLPGLTASATIIILLIALLWSILTNTEPDPESDRGRVIRLYIRVSNKAPNSYYRLVGRASGKQPPTKRLVEWAKRAKLPPTVGYVIARKIGKDGTERYRTGQNIVGVDPRKVQHRANSSFVRMLDRINAAL